MTRATVKREPAAGGKVIEHRITTTTTTDIRVQRQPDGGTTQTAQRVTTVTKTSHVNPPPGRLVVRSVVPPPGATPRNTTSVRSVQASPTRAPATAPAAAASRKLIAPPVARSASAHSNTGAVARIAPPAHAPRKIAAPVAAPAAKAASPRVIAAKGPAPKPVFYNNALVRATGDASVDNFNRNVVAAHALPMRAAHANTAATPTVASGPNNNNNNNNQNRAGAAPSSGNSGAVGRAVAPARTNLTTKTTPAPVPAKKSTPPPPHPRPAPPPNTSGSNSNNTGNEIATEGTACCICLSAPRSVLLLPCRHLCLCPECANTLFTHNYRNNASGGNDKRVPCPLCREKVDTTINTFV